MKNRMMVDIESLDTAPTTVVLSVGIVLFDEKEIIGSKYYILDANEQLQQGRSVSMSTLNFWMSQKGEAVDIFDQSASVGISVERFMNDFRGVYSTHNVQELWANGMLFDLGAIAQLYTSHRQALPWEYNHPRDFRTELKQNTHLEFERVKPELPHHAESDALAQTETLLNLEKAKK